MDVGAAERSHDSEELPMQTITTIGFDIAEVVKLLVRWHASFRIEFFRRALGQAMPKSFRRLPSLPEIGERARSKHRAEQSGSRVGNVTRRFGRGHVKDSVPVSRETRDHAIRQRETAQMARFLRARSAL
jgi:hypothetical protein